MNYFDVAIAVIIIAFIIMGFRKGLIAEVLGLLGIVIAFFLAIRFGGFAAGFIPERFKLPEILNYVAGFILVFGGVVIFFRMLTKALKSVIHPTALKGLDKIGGLMIGFAEGLLIASVIVFLFSLTPLADAAEEDIDESLFYYPTSKIAPMIFDTVYNIVPVDKKLNEIKDQVVEQLEDTKASEIIEEAGEQIDSAKEKAEDLNQEIY